MRQVIRIPLIIVALFHVYPTSPRAQMQDQRMVLVDGHRMRLKTASLQLAGRGQPVVVFESGLDTPLEAWGSVLTGVAAFAAVVAYDRAGIGESEADGQSPTPQHVARRLHSLLGQVGLGPPYVLVGHSWGAPLIRMFTALYPKEVAGLVYVDPTDLRSEEQELTYYKARGYSKEDVPKLRQKRRQQFRAYSSEMTVALDLEENYFADFRALPPVPDVPVVVLMAAKFDPAPWAQDPCRPRECHDAWVQLRIGWLTPIAQETTDGTFTLTTSSGHHIPRDDPDLVVWAIHRVVSSVHRRVDRDGVSGYDPYSKLMQAVVGTDPQELKPSKSASPVIPFITMSRGPRVNRARASAR